MAIKHLPGFTPKELRKKNPDIPIWKRREILFSPLVILVGIGYAIFGIGYGIFFAIKWLIFSWVAPFFNWEFFCKIGFHKYRKKGRGYTSTEYICKICKKEMAISND